MNKSRKKTGKKLRRGKKLEAKKPLFVAVEHGSTTSNLPTETVNMNYGTIEWKY